MQKLYTTLLLLGSGVGGLGPYTLSDRRLVITCDMHYSTASCGNTPDPPSHSGAESILNAWRPAN